jgi:inorganic pyrophosphatase
MRDRDLSRLRPFGPHAEYVNAIVETPKGSRIKYRYDPDAGLFLFDKMLPIGQTFPFDFGFLPSTKGGDGDPLDILLLVEEPTFAGCLVHAKLLGVIEAEQTQQDETERNDRFIAVPLEGKSGKPSGTVTKLAPSMARKISQFFVAYNRLQGKRFKTLRIAGPDRAATLIREGMSLATNRRKTHK